MSSFRHLQAKGHAEPKSEPPITFATERAFVDDLKKLSKPLAGLTEEWTARVASLNRVQKIVRDGAHKKYPGVFLEHANGEIRDGVIRQLGDSRSGVAVAAAHCIKALAPALKEQLDADPYAAAILRVMGTTNQVIKDAAHGAMVAVIESSRLGRAGVVLLAETVRTSKNAGQRQRATEYLRRVMGESARYGNGTLDKAADEIEAAVKKALSDGDPNVRAEARLAFKAYCGVWGDRGSALLESLDPSVKKYLTPSSAAAPAPSSLSAIKRNLASQGVKPSTTQKPIDTPTTTTTTTTTAKAIPKTTTSLTASRPSTVSTALSTKKAIIPTTTANPATTSKASVPTISSLSKSTAAALSQSKIAPAQKQQPQPSTVVKKLAEKRPLPQATGPDPKRFAAGPQKPTQISSAQKLHSSITVPATASHTASHSTITPRVDVSLAIKYGARDSVELKRKAIAMLKQAVQSGGVSSTEEENDKDNKDNEKEKDRTEKLPKKRDPRVAINIAAIASLLKATLANEACSAFEEDTLAVVLGLFEGYAGEAAYHLDDILTPVFTRLSKNSEHSELCERILGAALSGVKVDQLLGLARKLVLGRASGPGIESYAVLVFLEKMLEQSPESFSEFQRTKTLALSLASIPISSSPQALKDKAVEVLRTLYGIAKADFVKALKTLPPNVYANTVKHLPFIEPEANKNGGNEIVEDKGVGVDPDVKMNEEIKDNEGNKDAKGVKDDKGDEDEDMKEPEEDVKDEEKEANEMVVEETEKDLEEKKCDDEMKEMKETEEVKETKDNEQEQEQEQEQYIEENKKPPSTPQVLKKKAMEMLHSLSESGIVKSIKSLSASVYASTARHLPFMDSDETSEKDVNAPDPEIAQGNDENENENTSNEGNEDSRDEKENENENENAEEENEVSSKNEADSEIKDEPKEESAETAARVEKIAGALKTTTEKSHKKCPEGFRELSGLVESKPFLSGESAGIITSSLCDCLSPTQNSILRRTALQHMRSFAATFAIPVSALKEAFAALAAVIAECEAAQGDEDRTLGMAKNTLRALETAHPTELLQALLEVCEERDGETPLEVALHGLGGLFASAEKSAIAENEERIASVLAGHMSSDAVEIRKEAVFCVGECCLAHPERERFEQCLGNLLTPVQINIVHHYIDRKNHRMNQKGDNE